MSRPTTSGNFHFKNYELTNFVFITTVQRNVSGSNSLASNYAGWLIRETPSLL